jgi:hypothetical protein
MREIENTLLRILEMNRGNVTGRWRAGFYL